MKYCYVCDKCRTRKNFDFPMGSAIENMTCSCGGIMAQDFIGKLKSIQIDLPEDYKALSEYHSVDYGDDDVMEGALNGELL